MARPLRIEYPGAYYHVINRGNNKEKIFKNGRDREKFLQYLEKASERFSIIFHSSGSSPPTPSGLIGGIFEAATFFSPRRTLSEPEAGSLQKHYHPK